MLDLAAYSPAVLQSVRGLLADATAAGLDLGGLQAVVAARLARTLPLPSPVVEARPGRPAPRLCPSCGRGPLAPVANRDGLRILGCRLCRYSEVI